MRRAASWVPGFLWGDDSVLELGAGDGRTVL